MHTPEVAGSSVVAFVVAASVVVSRHSQREQYRLSAEPEQQSPPSQPHAHVLVTSSHTCENAAHRQAHVHASAEEEEEEEEEEAHEEAGRVAQKPRSAQ
jgi:hypothetical protein